ncbi:MULTISPECIES: hypothetical protein [Idiomarina]|jgi:hypothetical protein|uniref:DUF2846 domain-containing protein n=1 Tax=Idiomarina abyssalis TaxID=86102 RepID=A0A8I1KGA8_9GAMM|nr:MULTISPECIES: hypothetical protein [Idiomarina]MAO69271.1 hypothetical protein [Idiomarina sp.]MBF80655.1 hypothetical protein [Idiomarina sp.]MBJ7266499.1 hypothetical protein [Idiomarina abyssalis]MBJ7274446.1 hypothetical protein [Idiomarina abyssalis]MBJ7315498.1 hypothetical protein [Idiomarina abyssalis]|tara:strand:- start:323 stop:829 length:507 start_codon:yes stop_codon:yes gene_type:complete
MNNLKFVFVVIALLFSAQTLADWKAEGSGKVIYPSGRTEPLNFGFEYKKVYDTIIFTAGKSQMRTSEMPPNYILNLFVNKQGQVYVAEFANGFFKGFELNIGEHKISVNHRQEFDEEEPLRHLRVQINDRSFLLDTTHPTIKFEFDEEKGIVDINGSGLLKDLSSRGR